MAARRTPAASGSGQNRPGLETEIERSREDGNWKRVIKLAEQLRPRMEVLANFLIGEAKLEDFLDENPPKDANVSRAKDGLNEAKEHLMNTISAEEAKKLGVHLDSFILLGKLNFAQGEYQEALRFYDRYACCYFRLRYHGKGSLGHFLFKIYRDILEISAKNFPSR